MSFSAARSSFPLARAGASAAAGSTTCLLSSRLRGSPCFVWWREPSTSDGESALGLGGSVDGVEVGGGGSSSSPSLALAGRTGVIARKKLANVTSATGAVLRRSRRSIMTSATCPPYWNFVQYLYFNKICTSAIASKLTPG